GSENTDLQTQSEVETCLHYSFILTHIHSVKPHPVLHSDGSQPHTNTCLHAHTPTHKHTPTRTLTHTYTHVYTHMHTHIHSHTHTHTQTLTPDHQVGGGEE